MILDATRQPRPPAAEAILWQTKVRVALALVAGTAMASTFWAGVLPQSARLVLACVGGYVALIGGLHIVARHTRRAPSAAIAVMLLGDVALVLLTTAFTSRPAYHDRSLILSLVVLQLAEFGFGRVYTYLVAGAATSGYLALVATSVRHGAPLHWGAELFSVAAFLGAAALFALQFDRLRLAAGKLVALFKSAEEGDFSKEYDLGGDGQPDVIADLGRAYNRLQVQLQSMVLTDPLTGCLNRRGFDQALGREIARSSRAGSELALLAIDLDHFKRVNDRCGHLAGDAILRDLGALLQQSARAGDVVARTGGEEFTLVLPDTDAAGAYQLATRLCERIRGRAFVVEGRPIRLTVSVGVAAADADAVDRQGQELKLRADQALYAAKRLGRDRVLTWNE